MYAAAHSIVSCQKLIICATFMCYLPSLKLILNRRGGDVEFSSCMQLVLLWELDNCMIIANPCKYWLLNSSLRTVIDRTCLSIAERVTRFSRSVKLCISWMCARVCFHWWRSDLLSMVSTQFRKVIISVKLCFLPPHKWESHHRHKKVNHPSFSNSKAVNHDLLVNMSNQA